MDKKETIASLEKFGIVLKGRSRECLDAFCKEMLGRQYGVEETADAFLWFESGWKASRKISGEPEHRHDDTRPVKRRK
jgi:hypothetical protein